MQNNKSFAEMTAEEQQNDIKRLEDQLADIIGYNMSKVNSIDQVDNTTSKMMGLLSLSVNDNPERKEEIGIIMRKALNNNIPNN